MEDLNEDDLKEFNEFFIHDDMASIDGSDQKTYPEFDEDTGIKDP